MKTFRIVVVGVLVSSLTLGLVGCDRGKKESRAHGKETQRAHSEEIASTQTVLEPSDQPDFSVEPLKNLTVETNLLPPKLFLSLRKTLRCPQMMSE